MDGRSLQDRLNRAIARKKGPNEYWRVGLLILHWENTDLIGIQDEVEAVDQTFSRRFRYEVQRFAIPLSKPQRRLQEAVIQFIREYESEESLLIVYYGGHGDQDDKKGSDGQGMRRAVWSAYFSGGPTVDWYCVQPLLKECESDVLLLFDCCFGAQAARSRLTLPHRVELLASSGMREWAAPASSDRSFTKSMLEVLRECLDRGVEITVASLHARLLKKEGNPFATAVHVHLSDDSCSRRSIRLKPMIGNNDRNMRTDEYVNSDLEVPLVELRFNFTIAEDPSERTQAKLEDWLVREQPSFVSNFTVESVMQQKKRPQHLVTAEPHPVEKNANAGHISE